MKKVSCFVWAAAGIFLSIPTQAQQFKKNEMQTLLGKPQQDLFVNNSRQQIVVSYPYMQEDKGGVLVTAFDKQLSQAYSTEIKSFSDESYLGSIYSGSGLFLFGKTRSGDVMCTSVDDKSGAENGKQTLVFALQDPSEEEKIVVGSSSDSSHFYLFRKYDVKGEKGRGLQGVVMDKQMKVVASFRYVTPEKKTDVKEVQAVLTNDGKLNIFYNTVQNPKAEPYTPLLYTVVKIAQKSVTANALNGLPEGDIRNINWQDHNGTLSFTAFLSRKRKAGFTAVISGQYNPQLNKVTNVKETELSQLLDKDAGSSVYLKAISEKGLSSSVARDMSVVCRDGSTFITYEINSSSDYQSHYAQLPLAAGGNGAFPNASFSMTFNHAGDVFVLKLDADKQPLWLRAIRKDQTERDVNSYLGTCYAVDDLSRIHVFFYDSEKHSEVAPDTRVLEVNASAIKSLSMACVSIDKDGKMKKTFLYNAEDSDFHLSPVRSKLIRNNELVYIALNKGGGAAFTARQLYANKKYHLGVISIRP